MGLKTARAYIEQRKDLVFLSTGSKSLDTLICKGMQTGSTAEILGEFRTGKTQLCHTLCFTC